MTFNRNDFLDWAKNAQSNPILNQYKDHAKEFVNPTTSSEISAINNILDGGKNIIGKDNNNFRDANRQVEESAEKLDEAFPRKISTSVVDDRPTDKELADKSGYLKPSPKQLGKAIDTKKDDSPIFKHRGKEIRPSDVRAKARDKRIAKIAKAGKLAGKIFGKK